MLRTSSTVATSPAPMSQRPPIGVVWEEAHAHLLQVSEMLEMLESATVQLTEVLSMMLERVGTAGGSGLRETGSPIRRTSGEVSPVAQVSHEDSARVGEPTAEEVD